MEKEKFHEKLSTMVDQAVHDVYRLSQAFPKEETQGAAHQIRSSALGVALHSAGVQARKQLGSVEAAYGSLQATKYLTKFAQKQGWMSDKDTDGLMQNLEAIGGMLWGMTKRLKQAH
jgi:four helix bundle protein